MVWKKKAARLVTSAAENAMAEAATAQKIQSNKQRVLRVELLNEETDRLLAASQSRAESVDSKSSFLAVAAGIIIAAAVAQKWSTPGVLALLPLLFAVIGLALSAIALRPGKRKDLTPRNITQLWLDSEHTVATAQLEILKAKVTAFDIRERDLQGRAQISTLGFVALLLAAVALVTVYAFQIF